MVCQKKRKVLSYLHLCDPNALAHSAELILSPACLISSQIYSNLFFQTKKDQGRESIKVLGRLVTVFGSGLLFYDVLYSSFAVMRCGENGETAARMMNG